MAKTCVAAEWGSDVFAMLAVIVHTEDAARYRRPVTFHNATLMQILGITSDTTFWRVRSRAIESGWLVYIPAMRKRAPARYYVQLPAAAQGMDDHLGDDSDEESDDGTISNLKANSANDFKFDGDPEINVESKWNTFSPIPNPDPLKRADLNPKVGADGVLVGDLKSERKNASRVRWPAIKPADLDCPAFVDGCYHAAVSLGWIKVPSEVNRMNVHCAARSVRRRKSVTTPAAAFTSLVKGGKFGKFSASDEESARKAIRKLDSHPTAVPTATGSHEPNSPAEGNSQESGNSRSCGNSSSGSNSGGRRSNGGRRNSPNGATAEHSATATSVATVAKAATAVLAATTPELEEASGILDQAAFEQVREKRKAALRAKMASSRKPKSGDQDGKETKLERIG